MKIFKNILYIIINILVIALSIASVICVCWYAIPTLQVTSVGNMIIKALAPNILMWISIGVGIALILFYSIKKLCFRRFSAKYQNFFTHLTTWLMMLSAIALAIVGFIFGNVEIASFDLGKLRKTGILVCFGLLFLSHLISGKIGKFINRKIQSYENAKEMNVIGRSSIFMINLLKLIEILFPEIIVLTLICFCVSWNVAAYFLVILVASLLPMIGNIDCDLVTRREIIRNNRKQEEQLVENLANKLKGDK